MKAAFVYANPRARLAEEVAAGEAPDTGLLGQNHFADLGIETTIQEPVVRRRRQRESGLLHRLVWNLREVTLPWELGDADVAVTPLVNVLPFTSALRGRPRLIVLNYGLATTWDRATAPRRRVLRAALSRCSAVVCLGGEQRRRLVAQTGLEPERVRVVEIGVDESFFEARPVPADGYVLAVGKDLARDYGTLALAAGALDARVKIVAGTRNLADVSLPPNVDVVGHVTWHELRELYAGAACVALPLREPSYPYGTEGSGLTALVEAMASARPVVHSDRAVFADYVTPEESSVAVPPEEPEALRAAIEAVLGDRDLASRLGGRSRELVEERFTTRHMAERLAVLVREAAGG